MEQEHSGGNRAFGGAAPAAFPPAWVSLSPFSSPSSRRLSCGGLAQPGPASRKRLAWVSLQGRLVDAEEASSARDIGGGLSVDEAAAWEMFSPIQRFLIVAVIGVAVAESKKNRLIWQLTKSVELRDQVLSSMQQKLDSLCEQVNNIRDHSGARTETAFTKNAESLCNEAFGSDKISFVDCGCWLCDQHRVLHNGLPASSVRKASMGDEMLHYKLPFSNDAEQEERRMSDLSDWASSVTSSDTPMSTLGTEQEIYNLRKDCEEKETTIKELATLLQSSDLAGSKRIAELEDIIRRKNNIITRLKKDMVVLEQKVLHYTRLRRSSFPSLDSDSNSEQRPYMTENLLYDLDSTTSPSSSDSDSSPAYRAQAPVAKTAALSVKSGQPSSPRHQAPGPAKPSGSFGKLTDRNTKSQPVTPLKEISANRKPDTISSLGQKQLAVGDSSRKSRRRSVPKNVDRFQPRSLKVEECLFCCG